MVNTTSAFRSFAEISEEMKERSDAREAKKETPADQPIALLEGSTSTLDGEPNEDVKAAVSLNQDTVARLQSTKELPAQIKKEESLTSVSDSSSDVDDETPNQPDT